MFSLSKSELRQLIDAVNLAHPFGQRDYSLFNFMYHTALRVDECAHLITCLVALNGSPRQFLHLPAAISKGSRGRVVPLNDEAQECVENLIAFNRARGFSTAPAAPLFQNRCHGPLSKRSMQKIVKFHREKAGLDVRATPHTLRHSHASHLAEAGVPTTHIQKILGHRKLSSTQIYCHVSKEQLRLSTQALRPA